MYFHLDPQAIHVELSKLVKRQCGAKDGEEERTKPGHKHGDNSKEPLAIPTKKPSVSSKINTSSCLSLIPSKPDLFCRCCLLGTFLEVYTWSFGRGLGQPGDISDSDCEKLKTLTVVIIICLSAFEKDVGRSFSLLLHQRGFQGFKTTTETLQRKKKN